MARDRMQPRTFRSGPEWDDALTAAKARGENLPDVIRAFLKRYARSAAAANDPAHRISTALRIHSRDRRGNCKGCDGWDGEHGGRTVRWPCSTVQALVPKPTDTEEQ